MREVEVLRDQLLRMFEEDPVPPAQGHSGHDAGHRKLCALHSGRLRHFPGGRPKESLSALRTGASEKKEAWLRAFLAILDLEGSRFGGSQVLDLLECEAVRRRFGFSEEDLETDPHVDF